MDPPKSVSVVCGMVAWKGPSNAKLITGYDVHISLSESNQTFLVSKKYDELFHRIFQDDTFSYNAHQNFTASIKVSSVRHGNHKVLALSTSKVLFL